MAKSLQEQLMGTGLVDKKKAKSIQKEKRDKRKQAPKGKLQVDEVKLRTEQQQHEKVEHDRLLNKRRVEEQERKAIKAQIKQLILKNAISREGGNVGFQFADNKKIKKIFITEEQQKHLMRGQLAITILEEEYYLVPKGVAEKVSERDGDAISYLDETRSNAHIKVEEDPYKDYEIPDDLMW